MKQPSRKIRPALACVALALCAFASAAPQATPRPQQVGTSPWGAADEIGQLNRMTEQSRAAILQRISGGKTYDLSVDYFVGMPSFHALGDPQYQYWLTHTPRGTRVDDPAGVGEQQNRHVDYTGDAVSMYTHTGTHIDALNHFGLKGRIWNGFDPDKELGDKGWKKTGAETIPPIVARGVLIDVAGAKGLPMLPALHRVTADDLKQALAWQKTELRPGDVVLIRTGRMAVYKDGSAFIKDPPGLAMDGARFLAEEKGAMVIGADNLSLETFPSQVEGNWVPVHTYLLAERGIPIMELVYLDELARDRVYEMAFVGGSLKFRGASAAPMRPLAFPVRPH